MISKIKIRQDEVYERLSTNFNLLFENEVLWHASCYASYTNCQNLKYVTSKPSQSGGKDSEREVAASHVMVSQSTVDPVD